MVRFLTVPWVRSASFVFILVETPPISYKGRNLHFGDIVLMERDDPTLLFRCPEGSVYYNTSISAFDITFEGDDSVCIGEKNLTLRKNFWYDNLRSEAREVDIEIKMSNYLQIHLKFTLVAFRK